VRIAITILLLTAAGQQNVGAQSDQGAPATAPDSQESADARRHERFRALAESYTVYVDAKGHTEAVLRKEPIFRWTNPERRAIGGALYLWTHEGRPHATIGVWTYGDTQDSHELQSLSAQPFIAKSAQQHPDWNPRTAGLEFAPLIGAAPPADSEARRLVQMRSVGRQRFSASLTQNTVSGPQVETLRFLPQPIYRYEEHPPGVIDGAMFSFAQGTDPEVFLLLEARQEGEKLQWYYAFAPATSVSVAGSLDDKEIWNNADQLSNGTFVMYLNVDQ
jgi:hypothetical protein